MRRFLPLVPLFGVLCALGPLAPPAAALIKVDFPVSKLYATSQTVLIGTVERVNPSNRVVDVKADEAVKGAAPAARLRIQVVNPPETIKDTAAGDAVVVFVAKAKKPTQALAIVHLADTWLLAKPVPTAKTPAWRVVGPYDGKQGFPGRTVALARIVHEMKAGKSSLLDKVEHNVFRGGVKLLAKLGVPKAVAITPADVNGDGKPDLLVDSADRSRLFFATADGGYEDVTAKWCPWGAAAGGSAFGDVNADGRPDCLRDGALWLNTGKAFTAARVVFDTPEKARPLTAALSDATGDGKPDALLLAASGELRVYENPGPGVKNWPAKPPRMLWKDAGAPLAARFGDFGGDGRPHVMVVRTGGITRYPVCAESGPPADYERLTSVPLAKYHQAHRDGLKDVLVTTMDVNADHRADLFVMAAGHGLLLVNRGFGAYLVNPDAGGAVVSRGRQKVPFTLTPDTPWAAADIHGDGFDDLLVLTPDGTLYEVSNPPFRVGAGTGLRH